MKINTPEISWHAKEAIYSVDIQPRQENQPHRLATAGIDSNVRIWELKPESKTGVVFLSNLSRHERAVNVVRFSKSGKVLASGGDDGTIVLWKLSEKSDAPDIFNDDDSEVGKNVETWKASKILRGHLEDINDLSWSEDGKCMVSGSIDHTAMVWDISKGSKTCILSEAKHFIHGVAYDPLGQYIAALSCDRSLRIYSIQTKRVVHNISKMVYPEPEEDDMQADGEDAPAAKAQRMFHDESVVRRRLDFTSDGNILVVPSGCLTKNQGDQVEQMNTAYIFTRGCLSKPATILPGFKQPVTVIRSCPARFCLRKETQNNGDPVINIPYRHIFAVASSDTVLLYDTQSLEPFALIGNIHYAAITDITWSSDGRDLIISSRDGFCTIVHFEENELGELYTEKDILISEETDEKLSNTTEDDSRNSEKSTEDRSKDPKFSEDKKCSKSTSVVSEIENTQEDNLAEDCKTENNIKDNESKCESMDTNEDEKVPETKLESSQEKKPRRVQLTTLSDSPGAKQPRRVQLTMISSPKTEASRSALTPSKTSDENKPQENSPASATPKSTPTTENDTLEKKKAPRRIQLTPVND